MRHALGEDRKAKLRSMIYGFSMADVLDVVRSEAQRQLIEDEHDRSFQFKLKSDAYEDKSREWKRAESAELMRNIWFFVAMGSLVILTISILTRIH